jgi:hypothetical protein
MVEISGHGTIMIDGFPAENDALLYWLDRATVLPKVRFPLFGRTHAQSQEGKAGHA